MKSMMGPKMLVKNLLQQTEIEHMKTCKPCLFCCCLMLGKYHLFSEAYTVIFTWHK
jgi:hypothetical protein